MEEKDTNGLTESDKEQVAKASELFERLSEGHCIVMMDLNHGAYTYVASCTTGVYNMMRELLQVSPEVERAALEAVRDHTLAKIQELAIVNPVTGRPHHHND